MGVVVLLQTRLPGVAYRFGSSFMGHWMKTIAVGATLVALLAGTAHAADLYRKAPPAPVAPVASWTGFYAGVNVGGG